MATHRISRRSLLQGGASALAVSLGLPASSQTPKHRGSVKYQPQWESLKQWRMPEWFRDAKFGIWAHWTAQCVPEQGDWYARQMYLQGNPVYDFHCRTYGHPSKFGFMEIDNRWKAERWDPERLMDLYEAAGAKYFYALAAHHDNFDCFASSHHAWNSTRVGPMQDIVGTWEKIARRRGLRFGVSNHASHAWHWFQTAYGYDAQGPLAGARYDGWTLTKADGKGEWWEGLDPQELYTGRNIVIPDGIASAEAANLWHEQHDRVWDEAPPAGNPRFTRSWFLRCKELIDKYRPDMLYFDDTELPLGQAGLDITAYFYNSNMDWHGGREEAVVAAKGYTPEHMGATMLDIERGRAAGIIDAPWQTDTCIGEWHYKRSLFEQHQYKTPTLVAQSLIDIVSKNGNLMLNIPLRGDGTIDEDEHSFLETFARWMRVHGEAIYGTRPFKVFGEGAPDVAGTQNFNESRARPYDASDLRFTIKAGQLYCFALAWPADGRLLVKSLRSGNRLYEPAINAVQMLGHSGNLPFRQTSKGLEVMLPATPVGPVDAYAFRILT